MSGTKKSVSLILFLNTVYIFYQEIKLFYWVYNTLKVFLNEIFKKTFLSLKIAKWFGIKNFCFRMVLCFRKIECFAFIFSSSLAIKVFCQSTGCRFMVKKHLFSSFVIISFTLSFVKHNFNVWMNSSCFAGDIRKDE